MTTAKKARILLADDEPDLVWAIGRTLSGEGYEVLEAYDGFQALEVARRRRPDLVILDVVMPGKDGFAVCDELRRDVRMASIPILFLTARGDIEDRLRGLEEGADDYLAKPFDLRELRARVKALLRRSRIPVPVPQRGGEGQLVVGPMSLDVARRQLLVGGVSVHVTPAEFALLMYLMDHAGQVFSGRDLLQRVWGYPPTGLDPGLVRWHVRNLRSKIEPDPSHPRYLMTISSHGYVLAAEPTGED